MTTVTRSFFAIPARLLGFSCAAVALAPALGEQQPIIERVQVNLVSVEVVVTDGDGNTVPGLTREDFEVREDGRPVTVTHFYRVEGARGSGPVAPVPSEAQTTGVEAQVEAPVPEDQRLHLVIYVDSGYSLRSTGYYG